MNERTYLYELYHIRDLENDVQEVKQIGLYSTKKLAQEALERVKNKPGFVDFPNGFEINRVTLNVDGWVDGFIIDDE